MVLATRRRNMIATARRRLWPGVALVLASFVAAPAALGQETTGWLAKAAQAARTLNYSGTVVYQYGNRVETSRLVHLYDRGTEAEKLVNLDGPAREIIRTQ